PGYSRYCAYATGAKNGFWHGSTQTRPANSLNSPTPRTCPGTHTGLVVLTLAPAPQDAAVGRAGHALVAERCARAERPFGRSRANHMAAGASQPYRRLDARPPQLLDHSL